MKKSAYGVYDTVTLRDENNRILELHGELSPNGIRFISLDKYKELKAGAGDHEKFCISGPPLFYPSGVYSIVYQGKKRKHILKEEYSNNSQKMKALKNRKMRIDNFACAAEDYTEALKLHTKMDVVRVKHSNSHVIGDPDDYRYIVSPFGCGIHQSFRQASTQPDFDIVITKDGIDYTLDDDEWCYDDNGNIAIDLDSIVWRHDSSHENRSYFNKQLRSKFPALTSTQATENIQRLNREIEIQNEACRYCDVCCSDCVGRTNMDNHYEEMEYYKENYPTEYALYGK